MVNCLAVFIFVCLLVSGCAPTSLDDYRHEGEAVGREILIDLQKIHTRDDLVQGEMRLKKKFEKLVSLILDARIFILDHPDLESFTPSAIDMEVSQLLKIEMERIYSIEGGREIIEKAQREAMLRLDGFEKAREKQKKLRIK